MGGIYAYGPCIGQYQYHYRQSNIWAGIYAYGPCIGQYQYQDRQSNIWACI